jgi:hypothetical protein
MGASVCKLAPLFRSFSSSPFDPKLLWPLFDSQQRQKTDSFAHLDYILLFDFLSFRIDLLTAVTFSTALTVSFKFQFASCSKLIFAARVESMNDNRVLN